MIAARFDGLYTACVVYSSLERVGKPIENMRSFDNLFREEFTLGKMTDVLYVDMQDQVPACYCRVCGGARYAPSLICIRCERNRP